MGTTQAKRLLVIGNYRKQTIDLIGRLMDGTPGDVLADDELQSVCGMPTGTGQDGYPYLLSAIKYVQRNGNVVWKRVRGEGCIRCCNAEEIIKTAKGAVGGIRRRTRKIARSLDIAGTQELTDDQRREANTLAAQVGTLTMMTSRKAVKVIEERQEMPSREKLLAVFMK